MTEKGGPEEKKRPLPRWVGTVTFGVRSYDIPILGVAVDATSAHVAAYRAVLRAKARRADLRRKRVDRVVVVLNRWKEKNDE